MRNRSMAPKARVVIFGIMSLLLLLSLTTAQIALAGPSAAPDGQTVGTTGTVPTPEPQPTTPPAAPTVPPPPPPAVATATATSVPVPTPTLAPGVTPTATPVPTAVPTRVPGAPPPSAPPVTTAYDWFTEAEITVPIFEAPPAAPTATPAATPLPGQPTSTPAPTAVPATPQPKVALKVPARSMSVGGQPASGQITVKPVAASSVPTTDSGTLPDRPTLVFGGRSVEVDVFGLTAGTSAADITSEVRFNPPLTITFDITEAEWEAANGDTSKFEVRFFSTSENRWISLPGDVNPFVPRSVSATVTHLTTFGVFIETATEVAPAPEGGDFTLGGAWLAMASALGLAFVASGLYLRRRSSRAS